ncbi:MAG: hypothetical protein WB988_06400, partial [Candidatus Nitrosopolaris sp.]
TQNNINPTRGVKVNITLAIYRNGHAIDLKVTLAARPSLLPILITQSTPPSMSHPPKGPPTIHIPHPSLFP